MIDLLKRLDDWFAAITPQQRLALAFACLAIVVAQGLVIGLSTGPGSTSYNVASSNRPAEERTTILVSFAPNAPAEEVSKLLLELDLLIVDGPRPGGIYRVAIAPEQTTTEVIDRLLASRNVVVFAAEERAP